MAYDLPNFTNGSRGIEDILSYEATQVAGFTGGILFFIYVVILTSGYFSQERRTGAGNLPMWAAISGLITTTGGFILFLYQTSTTGLILINLPTLLICVIVTIVSAIFFLASELRD